MATIINADTSNGLKLTSDTSGIIQLQSGGTTIATVNSSGITMASGKLLAPTGPAFRAYLSSNQSITAGVFTKVAYDTEEFDTASAYDNSTNFRFLPNVAGYYQINYSAAVEATATVSRAFVELYKNGASYERSVYMTTVGGTEQTLQGSALVHLNGSSDYLEVYQRQDGGSNNNIRAIYGSGPMPTVFSGVLVRAE